MSRRHSLPAEVYALVEHTPATVLLEGREQNNCKSREEPWTQLFTDPLRVCTAHTPAEIPALFAAIADAMAAGHLAAGFFSYECGTCFEPKAAAHTSNAGPATPHPLAWIGVYGHSYAFDRATGEFVGGEPPGLARFRAEEHSAIAGSARPPEPPPEIAAEFALGEPEYTRRIAAIHEWIRAGDVYQLNFTAPIRVKAPGSVAAHYAQLRARQPVDYGAFLHWQQGHHILSFSPELFFRVDREREARRIVARPMKGTARRGRTTREDRELAEWLRNDPKNRSENVMIVDLLRNDLGRVARFGTVGTENLFAVERYPTLWQMTSTVTAELRPGIGFHEIFRALFPCGSITGAPKVRAMQLIAELEGRPRGVYTGAIGYFSPQRTVFNVAIRTLELSGGEGVMGVGSGIVIDSDPAEEFRECLLKAKFLTGLAHRSISSGTETDDWLLIETLLWNGTYPLLELHLDRLADSADYFGFVCDRAAIGASLDQYASQFAKAEPGSPRRVRLLLDAGGELTLTSEALAPENQDRIARVRISSTRTDPADPALYHKTTQRTLYAQELKQAAESGFDDVLFMNLSGEITEGAISNVFIEKDGRWFTPPVECGLLAGVYRRHLLEARPKIEQRVLTLDDLRSADAIYLTNAVRGLRRAEIV
jgi:para-aminobenzoate synthetase/4-amino-4-deoxychorismate lyase